MRKLSVLLALAVVAAATPALAGTHYFHPLYDASGGGNYPYDAATLTALDSSVTSFHASKWYDGGFDSAPPGLDDLAQIADGTDGGHGPTAVITTDVDLTGANGGMRLGAFGQGGHIRQDSGSVETSSITIAHVNDSDASQGSYTINGGDLTTWTLKVGSLTDTVAAISAQFIIGGSTPTAIAVGTGDFDLYSDGDLVLNLDASANGVTKMTVGNNATVAGQIILGNLGTFTGTSIDILTAAGTLDYTGATLDAASVAAGWSLTDDGSGTLQAIPEPATMVLLGLGGLGVFLRRRRA